MDDLISRQAAIDALCEDYCSGHHDCKCYPKCENLRAIQDLPSAQPEQHLDEWCTDCREYDQTKHCCPRFNRVIRTAMADASRWVPCDERLPEEKRTTYWVCTEEGYQYVCRWTNMDRLGMQPGEYWHWNMFDLPMHTKVVAWKLLPEPYKPEKERRE